MKYLVIERSDGGVSVRTLIESKARRAPKTGQPIPPRDFDYEEEVAHWTARPGVRARGWTAVSWYVTDNHPSPEADSTFRDAFKVKGKKIVVDMEKARAIHMDRIRRVRDRELAKLDTDYMWADEAGDDAHKRAIASKKQALRDLPATFDLGRYSVPRTLKRAWPKDLPPPDESDA